MQQSDSVLITTYTIANELEIRKKIVELNGFVPHNVTIQTWYSFLLQHGVRPFQGVVLDDKINGMILVNEKSGKKYDGKYGPVYFAEDDYRKFYFTDGMKMYSDKIAKFVCRCEKETKGRVSQRISRIYPKIYVDEIQDLAGYDLDIIKSLLQAECDVTMVGDPRQVTYHTHNETSVYKGYKQDKIEMRGDRAEMSDFPLYLNTVAGGLDRRDQTIGGFSFVVKIYTVPVVEIIG